jgi:hypothetical protein
MGEAGASRAAGHRVVAAQLTTPGGTAYVPVNHLLIQTSQRKRQWKQPTRWAPGLPRICRGVTRSSPGRDE